MTHRHTGVYQLKPAAFYFLPAILLVAMIACSNTEDPVIDEDLLSVVWRVDSLQTPDTSLVADSLDYLSIRFDETFEVIGSKGCAGFGGKYRNGKNERIEIYEISIPHIALPCTPHENLMARIYLDILENIEAYSIAGDVLILSSSDRSFLVSYTAE